MSETTIPAETGIVPTLLDKVKATVQSAFEKFQAELKSLEADGVRIEHSFAGALKAAFVAIERFPVELFDGAEEITLRAVKDAEGVIVGAEKKIF